MKLILKLLCAPVIFVLWIFTGLCNLMIRLSSVALFFVAILFALAAVLKLAEGFTASAIVGFLVAFLLSPFGLPMAATLILARFYGLRYWLQDKVYGL